MARRPVTLYIGTRKGAFLLRSPDRRTWKQSAPAFLGHIVHHVVPDPRDRRTVLMAARAGHLGPTMYRSANGGRTWQEVARPPAFPKATGDAPALSVDHVFWLTPGHAQEPGVWYAGTSPQGLFRSEDGGVTWEGVAGFNAHPQRAAWVGDTQQSPPGGATLHSINVDPRDANHLWIGMSAGGAFESRDRGASWTPVNRGISAEFLPDPDPEYGHDVHCLRVHPANPDVIYHQNHCGIYRLERPATRWERIGNAMPKKVGDIGFPLVAHPRDPGTVWVFPMDGTSVWPRVNPGGRPAAYGTRNGGRTWQRLAKGFPERNAWWNVKRQAMTCDAHDPVGLYAGTTNGEVWASANEGAAWRCIARDLPEVYSVECLGA